MLLESVVVELNTILTYAAVVLGLFLIPGPAVLLASDEGRWIQGAEIFVDGGFTNS